MTWYRVHFFDVQSEPTLPMDLEHAEFHFSSKNDHSGQLLGKILHHFSAQWTTPALDFLDYADDLSYQQLQKHAQIFDLQQQKDMVAQVNQLLIALAEIELDDLEQLCEIELSEAVRKIWLKDTAQIQSDDEIDSDADDLYSLLQILNQLKKLLQHAIDQHAYVIYRSFCQ